MKGGTTPGRGWKSHNKTSQCQKEKRWVKSNPKGEESAVTPVPHISAQPTKEIGGLLQPRPCRLNYFHKVRGTKA